jgi:hypothetical protein
MADKNDRELKHDDPDDDRRQFMARFGKLALVAAPTVAVLVTSMNTRAIAASSCRSGYHLNEDGHCVKNDD